MSKMVARVSFTALAAALALAAPAAAKDYATTALNIVPSGQLQPAEVIPGAPAGAILPGDTQAKMYDGLTPLGRNVSPTDLTTYFKSEALDPGVTVVEEKPAERPGVTIKRDSYGVPHIYGVTDADVIWGAGYVEAEDRWLLLNQARYNGLLAAIDAPNISAISLIAGLAQFEPSSQTNAIVDQQTKALQAAGTFGKQTLADLDVYLEGINAWFAKNQATTPKFTRRDIYAINAVKGQFLGEGGGEEVKNAELLDALRDKLGSTRGTSVWGDLRERQDDDSQATYAEKTFKYQDQPKAFTGNVVLEKASFKPVTFKGASSASLPASVASHENLASNVLMVSGSRTATGHPLFVAGPQIGYFYPGLTLEMGLHGPSIETRGAVSAPFPGYMLIGRGEDYAWSLTSAGLDIVDNYAETLCGGSKLKYLYKGTCRKMEKIDAGVLSQGGKKAKVVFYRTIHGPVIGYAKRANAKTVVAIARKRSSYGQDVVDQLFFQQMTFGRVKSFADFRKAAALTPQTFNSFYADDKHIGFYTTGKLPLRHAGSTGDLPIDGRGGYEWSGFLKDSAHPQALDPKSGLIVNWNNKPVKGFPAGDDRFGSEGPIQRVQLLTNELERTPQHTLATVTGAMNAAATEDVRGQILWPTLKVVLAKGTAPSSRETAMVALLDQWAAGGASRLDGDGDGKIDAPGAAILDAAFPLLAKAAMCAPLGSALCDRVASRVSIFDQPPGGQYEGPQDAARQAGEAQVLHGLLRQGQGRRVRERAVGGAQAGRRQARDRPGRRSGGVAQGRQPRADRVHAAVADRHAVHEPAERDSAGHLLRRPPVARFADLAGAAGVLGRSRAEHATRPASLAAPAISRSGRG